MARLEGRSKSMENFYERYSEIRKHRRPYLRAAESILPGSLTAPGTRTAASVSGRSGLRQATTQRYWPSNILITHLLGQVTFEGRFDVELSTDCTEDYLEVQGWEETSHHWVTIGNRLCGRELPSPVTTLTSHSRIVFRSNGVREEARVTL